VRRMPLGQQPQQATAVGHDGRELCFWQWASPDHPVGQILLVHGLGEHARRYDALADVLTDVGWRVSAYDQIGHGQSPGRRGDQGIDHARFGRKR
jgi:alpha-beta hydrolase superfamily lysophospholipase